MVRKKTWVKKNIQQSSGMIRLREFADGAFQNSTLRPNQEKKASSRSLSSRERGTLGPSPLLRPNPDTTVILDRPTYQKRPVDRWRHAYRIFTAGDWHGIPRFLTPDPIEVVHLGEEVATTMPKAAAPAHR
jgi:hypothetical protein